MTKNMLWISNFLWQVTCLENQFHAIRFLVVSSSTPRNRQNHLVSSPGREVGVWVNGEDGEEFDGHDRDHDDDHSDNNNDHNDDHGDNNDDK